MNCRINRQLIALARQRMNSKCAALVVARHLAAEAHKAKQFSQWSRLMHKARRLGKELAGLAEYLHTLLIQVGATRVKVTSHTGMTTRELYTLLWPTSPAFIQPQAE
jgi:hypothetical protein